MDEDKDLSIISEGINSINIYGARVNNLKNIDLIIPHNKLTVITGISGSGKSSLAFNTVYAEGQRRYMETFSAYARQYIGTLERPDVDKIEGLSPVVAIEQKTVNKNPRSTVGTITEIYDLLRLLYARIADAYSYVTGEKMIKYNVPKILDIIEKDFENKKITILAPIVKARKGHYRELFESIRKTGFSKVRIDGEITEINFGLQLDRYKMHNIEVVIDSIIVNKSSNYRLNDSVELALKHGKGSMLIIDDDMGSDNTRHFSKFLMCPTSGIAYEEPEPNNFSFNSPYGACQKCNGLGKISSVEENKIIPDKTKSIRDGAISPAGVYKKSWIFEQLEVIADKYGFTLDTPIGEVPDDAIQTILFGTDEVHKIEKISFGVSTVYSLNFDGIVNFIKKQYEENESISLKKWALSFMQDIACPECSGKRLKKESLHFKILDKSISDVAEMDIIAVMSWIDELEGTLEYRKKAIATEILKEVRKRLNFLINVGIDYLSLNRPSYTLSGGESQRIRLATQIGSKLMGVTYILDEPSIGLHLKDNVKLINTLKELRDVGNTVIVVEHDKEMMLAADYLVDIGPAAGIHGGHIVAAGTPEEVMRHNTLTTKYLKNIKKIVIPKKRKKGNGKFLELTGCKGNNLKNVNLKIPLGTMTCITGVSGSGKSSLINSTLYPILGNKLYRLESVKPLEYKSIKGLENIDKVIDINQSPIGRTSRSNPVTYTKIFDDIRNLFAMLPESQIRGYKSGRFSFNVKGGRCETCQGAGIKTIEMNFMPDVFVECETCGGKRYTRETLEVRYKGKSINDVLDMTVEEALEFFENVHYIKNSIKTLYDVGLGYVRLGQSSTTLSGGEAQRIKLSAELSKKDTGKTLYILDEPTTGLHFEDVKILLGILSNLVDRGNTVLIIEHNMDVIKVADYIIDMGPEGGSRGGYIVCEGKPEEIAGEIKSHTAVYLKTILEIEK